MHEVITASIWGAIGWGSVGGLVGAAVFATVLYLLPYAHPWKSTWYWQCFVIAMSLFVIGELVLIRFYALQQLYLVGVLTLGLSGFTFCVLGLYPIQYSHDYLSVRLSMKWKVGFGFGFPTLCSGVVGLLANLYWFRIS